MRFLAAVLVACPALAAAAPFEVEEYRKGENRPRVIFAARDTLEATIYVQLEVGNANDLSSPGRTRVAQLALLDGGPGTPAERLQRRLYPTAAELQVITGVRRSAFMLTAQREDFAELAELLLKSIFSGRATTLMFDRESESADPHASLLAMTIGVLPKTRLGPRFSLELVTAHLQEYFRPANATIVVAGGFERAKLLRSIDQLSGGTEAEDFPKIKGYAGEHAGEAGIEVHLIAYPIALRSTRDVAAQLLLTALLEERVQTHFRRLGVIYSSDCAALRTEWLEAILVVLPFSDQVGRATADLDKLIAAAGEQGFGEEFLEKNRGYLLAKIERIDRDPSELAIMLAAGSKEAPGWGAALVEEVRRLSAAEMQAYAASWLIKRDAIHAKLSPRAAARERRR